MILQDLITFVLSIFTPVVNMFPDVNFDAALQSESVMLFIGWIKAAAYFLPMETLLGVMQAIIGIYIFRIGVSFLKNFWSVLPIV